MSFITLLSDQWKFPAVTTLFVLSFAISCSTNNQTDQPSYIDHEDFTPQPPVLAVSPEEQKKSFLLQPGYQIEAVLTEPVIMEPMQIEFDGNGRMYVLEMRTYMQDIDATDELEPRSRISMHEDTDNDGIYDQHTVFIDKMVIPRFVMPFGPNSVLSMESNQDDVWLYTDTTGDGVADKKELFTTSFGRSANIEHQQSSLRWSMDNWLYSTYNSFRIRWTPDGIIREATGSPGGAWGVTHDDFGKTYIQGGASGLPGYFQFPIHYGNFRWSERFEPGLEIPYGVAGVADFEPGPQAARENGTLNRVTGSAGNDVIRGHRMPEDLVGDYLYGEPVARIVRRLRMEDRQGLTQLRNLYQKEESEFIRSTDHLFRPVQLATAPDGTLYIVDTYRGIIQQGNWTQEGSYLREKILQYQFDKVYNNGRIWRLSHEKTGRDTTRPRMHEETSAELVRHLEHKNGWWRDTAQRLLVLQQDKSVAPALQDIVRSSDNLYGRFHALWTLEGLNTLEPDFIREQLNDPSAAMRIQAIRASETLYKKGDTSFEFDYREKLNDTNPDVVIQSLLTLFHFRVSDMVDIARSFSQGDRAEGVQFVSEQILNKLENPALPPLSGLTETEADKVRRGFDIYSGLCNSCHGDDGRGIRVTGASEGSLMAPSLAGSDGVNGHRDYVIKTLLHGLESDDSVMISMGMNDDDWIAAVGSYIRRDFTNKATMIKSEDVARVRAAHADRESPWAREELAGSLPQLLEPEPTWVVTASHSAPARVGGTTEPSRAFNYEGWTTGQPQQAGMWFQVEFPSGASLIEVEFISPTENRGEERLRTSPMEFQLDVSMNGEGWTTIARGSADGTSTTNITFDPVQTRFIRIIQTDGDIEDAPSWTIQNLKLFE